MSDLFNIGISGLKTSQRQLATTGRNIANDNTPGYIRQRTEQSSQAAGYSGAGYTGNGVQADTTIRFYEEFLEQQVRDSHSQLSRFESYHELSGQIDNILGNSDTGLSPSLDNFFNAVQESNNYPASTAARSVLLTSANNLTDRFQLIHNQLNELNNQSNTRLADISSEISARSKSIARLNEQIASYRGNGSPNNLLDRREQLIMEVAERIDVNVEYDNNGQGAVNVFVGSGQPLVLANNGYAIGVSQGEYSSAEREILLYGGKGSTAITEQIQGGELQGVLDFKEEVLNPAFNALGNIAAGLSAEFNDQHQMGMTLRESSPGVFNLGGDFFSDLRGPNQVLSSSNNQGTAAFGYNLGDTAVLTSSDFEMSFGSAAGVDTFTLTRLEDGISFSGSGASSAAALTALNSDLANLPANSINTSQGFSLSLTSGAIQSGDKFLIQPTHDLASKMAVQVNDVKDIALANPLQLSHGINNNPTDDNRNGLQLAELQSKKSMLNSSSDFQSAYGLMTAGVGTLTHSSSLDISAQTTINEQTLASRNSLSGVNLDEEAANLLKFQQSYMAATKVISAADDVFKTLLDATD